MGSSISFSTPTTRTTASSIPSTSRTLRYQASPLPDNTNFPGLHTEGYTITPAIPTPGPTQREAVVIEWTDTNTANATFEGTAREVLRVQLNSDSHPMGGLIFNPSAKPGTPDWRVLYIACGDGRSGESSNPAIRQNPQRLDNFSGEDPAHHSRSQPT